MRALVTARIRSLFGGWLWVPVVLLVLPGCDQVFGLNRVNDPVLPLGPLPRGAALFCDIEKMSVPRHCATQDDIGIALSNAAVALTTRNSQGIALDYSEAARSALNCGSQPVVVTYEGRFPEGYPVCVKCIAAIGPTPATYETVNALCVDQCRDLNVDNADQTAVAQFCQDRARASTNSPQDDCFGGACTPAGSLRDDYDAPEFPAFIDRRRIPEPVIWTDLIGMAPNGNSLTRTAPTTGNVDAGAVSSQWITRGDAYVEFSGAEVNRTHIAGLSEIPAACPFPCSDTDGSGNIDFALVLNVDGRIYLAESLTQLQGPGQGGSWGNYAAGERFRVTVTDNNVAAGTAKITYSRIQGTCTPGNACAETLIRASTRTAHYPLRVDTSSREVGAKLTDVRVVRIR